MPSGEKIELSPAAPIDAVEAERLCRRLREAGARELARMPLAEIVAIIDRAVAGWGDREATGRRTLVSALAAETGYHPMMVDVALAELAVTFREADLWRLVRRELADPGLLDDFVPQAGGGWERAYGPGLTAIVLSGNVFPVAVESMILALLAKSPALVKASARDRLFPALFARSIAATEPRTGEAMAVRWWTGGDEAVERAVFGAVDAVVVYGSADAVAAVRGRTPAATRFIAHGPKISFGIVAPDYTADPAMARAAAHDVSWFDQQGCVSPHTLYVLGGSSDAIAVARLLATEMAVVEQAMPRGTLTPAEAARVHQARGVAEFRPGVEVLAPPSGTAWTVIADPDPAFGVSCLNRVVYIKPLARIEALPDLLSPIQPYLQTAGVAGDDSFRRTVASVLGPLGVARICPLGQMQHPPADWRHDGRPRLLDLLRWTEVGGGSGPRLAGAGSAG